MRMIGRGTTSRRKIPEAKRTKRKPLQSRMPSSFPDFGKYVRAINFWEEARSCREIHPELGANIGFLRLKQRLLFLESRKKFYQGKMNQAQLREFEYEMHEIEELIHDIKSQNISFRGFHEISKERAEKEEAIARELQRLLGKRRWEEIKKENRAKKASKKAAKKYDKGKQ